MSLKANLQFFINFNQIQSKRLMRQGYIKFCLRLYFLISNNKKENLNLTIKKNKNKRKKIICHPYNIIRNLPNNNFQQQKIVNKKEEKIYIIQSQIDKNSQYYFSPVIYIKYDDDKYYINETCSFKAYLDVQDYHKFLDQNQYHFQEKEKQKTAYDQIDSSLSKQIILKAQGKLLFTQDIQNKFSEVGSFEADIRKINNIGCYFPLTFDKFGGFQIKSSYHATILQYKFSSSNKTLNQLSSSSRSQSSQDQKYQNIPSNTMNIDSTLKQYNKTFYQYLLQKNKKGKSIRNIYNHYRNQIEQELLNIQKRFVKLTQIILFKSSQKQINNFQKTCQNNNNSMISSSQKFDLDQDFKFGISPTLRKYISSQKKNLNIQVSQFDISNYNQNKNLKKKVLLSQIPLNTHLIKKIQLYDKNKDQLTLKQISQQILQDFAHSKAFLYEKWIQYTFLIYQNSSIVTKQYRNQYYQLIKERFKNNIFSHKITNHDWTFCKYEDSGKSHQQCSSKQKLKGYDDFHYELLCENHPIQNYHYFNGHSKQLEHSVKFFEEIYYPPQVTKLKASTSQAFHENFKINNGFLLYADNTKKNKYNYMNEKSLSSSFNSINKINNQKNNKKHLIVLVHGFQASRVDFLLLKSCLQINYPNVQVMLSFCNQGRTEESIQVLGKRLAVQVANYLANICSSKNNQKQEQNQQCKISFIGHSMGGLIIRSALIYLKNLQNRLHTYISICTPHLGYLYQAAPLVQVGLWLINTWNKCASIKQITMQDSPSKKDSFLYKLSQKGSLRHFKNICFMTSSQDEYVPFQSARVQKNMRLFSEMKNDQNCKLVNQMINNIFSDFVNTNQQSVEIYCQNENQSNKGNIIESPTISRIDVIFNQMQKNFDFFIGRTGHIMFLSDQQFIKQFVMCFQKFFN